MSSRTNNDPRMARIAGCVLAVLVLSAAFGAFAQAAFAQDEGPTPTQERLARRLRADGVEAARTGDWPRAATLFEEAYELDPRVLTLYNLAAAQMNSGLLVEADENFRRFLRATQEGTHDEFRAEASASRGLLEHRIPHASVANRRVACPR